MIRALPEGEIAEFYDPTIWRELDVWLRMRRIDQLSRISTMTGDIEAIRREQGVLSGLDEVRRQANELMRKRDNA